MVEGWTAGGKRNKGGGLVTKGERRGDTSAGVRWGGVGGVGKGFHKDGARLAQRHD